MPQAQSQLQVHGAHIALFLVWLVIFAAVYARDRVAQARSGTGRRAPAGRPDPRYLGGIALAAVVAGAGDVEPFGIRDAIASAAELANALLCLPALYRSRGSAGRYGAEPAVAPPAVSPSDAMI